MSTFLTIQTWLTRWRMLLYCCHVISLFCCVVVFMYCCVDVLLYCCNVILLFCCDVVFVHCCVDVLLYCCNVILLFGCVVVFVYCRVDVLLYCCLGVYCHPCWSFCTSSRNIQNNSCCNVDLNSSYITGNTRNYSCSWKYKNKKLLLTIDFSNGPERQ